MDAMPARTGPTTRDSETDLSHTYEVNHYEAVPGRREFTTLLIGGGHLQLAVGNSGGSGSATVLANRADLATLRDLLTDYLDETEKEEG
ncbi:MAG: hypothetical protein WC998_06910 [Candidatus Paceibacterota bacterium]|jgi:hypothetical protein